MHLWVVSLRASGGQQSGCFAVSVGGDTYIHKLRHGDREMANNSHQEEVGNVADKKWKAMWKRNGNGQQEKWNQRNGTKEMDNMK